MLYLLSNSQDKVRIECWKANMNSMLPAAQQTPVVVRIRVSDCNTYGNEIAIRRSQEAELLKYRTLEFTHLCRLFLSAIISSNLKISETDCMAEMRTLLHTELSTPVTLLNRIIGNLSWLADVPNSQHISVLRIFKSFCAELRRSAVKNELPGFIGTYILRVEQAVMLVEANATYN